MRDDGHELLADLMTQQTRESTQRAFAPSIFVYNTECDTKSGEPGRVRIFKNAWVERFAHKQKIQDAALRDAVHRAEQGLVDADLGGGVIKQRVARPGQGRSGGYRTLILYRQAHRAFFVYGFAKSQQANISDEETAVFKKAARHVLELTDAQLAALIRNGQFSEVDDYG